MSWDISITGASCSLCGHTEAPAFYGNYTSNVAAMFFLAFAGTNIRRDGFRGLDGKSGEDAAALLKHAIEFFRVHEDQLRTLATENGWGSYEGARDLLMRMLDAVESAPNLTVQVR